MRHTASVAMAARSEALAEAGEELVEEGVTGIVESQAASAAARKLAVEGISETAEGAAKMGSAAAEEE